MRLLLFRPRPHGGDPRMGLLHGTRVIDPARFWVEEAKGPFPHDLVTLLSSNEVEFCRSLLSRMAQPPSTHPERGVHNLDRVEILPPVPRPGTFRDFYSFEEHVRRARAQRGLEVPPAWYRRPTFYFSNPNAIYGPEQEIPIPAATAALDFELEIGCVIGRAGRDISPEDAGSHIAGYTLLNDWSARDVQAEEVTVGLGPAKGKDFATSLGPWLVTPEELAPLRAGPGYDCRLEVRRNQKLLGSGNWKSIRWSFEEMIALASRDAWLFPGDLLGSGTVGGGCILEIGEDAAGGWLRPGDEVALSGGPLGTLRNRVGPSRSPETR